MAFCSKCGSIVPDGAAFCSSCGIQAASPSGGSGANASVAMSTNVAAALSYLLGPITGIFFLMADAYKNDKFVRFHAFQSIFFSVAAFIVLGVWNKLVLMMFYSIGFLWMIFGFVSSIISLVVFVLWIFLMYKAYNKEKYMLPFIGEWAAKQAGS